MPSSVFATCFRVMQVHCWASTPAAVETTSPVQPSQRRIYWRYFYDNGRRHLCEASTGNTCTLCMMRCHSFSVSGLFLPVFVIVFSLSMPRMELILSHGCTVTTRLF